jgi:hypothetical protein
MLHLPQKDQCGRRLASAQSMLSRSMKPVVRTAQPSSGEIKAMYEEAKKGMKQVEKIGGYDLDDVSQDFSRFVKQKLEDIDYDYGKDVIHASNQEGLPEISPMAHSAAAEQGAFGLKPEDAVAFAYNPKSPFYVNNENAMVQKMLETASQANVKTGKPTVYLARAPLTGIVPSQDMDDRGWFMSIKPFRVKDSQPLERSNTRKIEDMIRTVSGGEDPDIRAAREAAESKARLAQSLEDSKNSVA